MKATDDIPAFLLRLNLDLADLETKGQSIAPPGLLFPISECIDPV
jgi:hypothetical protein